MLEDEKEQLKQRVQELEGQVQGLEGRKSLTNNGDKNHRKMFFIDCE